MTPGLVRDAATAAAAARINIQLRCIDAALGDIEALAAQGLLGRWSAGVENDLRSCRARLEEVSKEVNGSPRNIKASQIR